MRRRITNIASAQSPAGAGLLRRLCGGLWFLLQTTGVAEERRRRRQHNNRRRPAPQVRSLSTTVNLRSSSAHRIPKTPNRFNRFLTPAVVAALLYSASLWAHPAPLSLARGQKLLPAGDTRGCPKPVSQFGVVVAPWDLPATAVAFVFPELNARLRNPSVTTGGRRSVEGSTTTAVSHE